jgi:hypothetical protein
MIKLMILELIRIVLIVAIWYIMSQIFDKDKQD